jgi:CDP-diacylglycerol--glycerol-3-phosphate 3-phosphatidyltransferase
MDGRVVAIYIAKAAGVPTEPVEQVRAFPGRCLEGDRYFAAEGTFSADRKPGRDVTLIEREAIDAIAHEYDIRVELGDSRRNLVTDFGKIADPIADKALTGAALIVLSLQGELWWWVTIAILLREWGITLLRIAVLRYGVMPASSGGKLKTVLQIVAISIYLFPLYLLPFTDVFVWIAHGVMAAALAVTLWTGLTYVLDAVRLVRAKGATGTQGTPGTQNGASE